MGRCPGSLVCPVSFIAFVGVATRRRAPAIGRRGGVSDPFPAPAAARIALDGQISRRPAWIDHMRRQVVGVERGEARNSVRRGMGLRQQFALWLFVLQTDAPARAREFELRRARRSNGRCASFGARLLQAGHAVATAAPLLSSVFIVAVDRLVNPERRPSKLPASSPWNSAMELA